MKKENRYSSAVASEAEIAAKLATSASKVHARVLVAAVEKMTSLVEKTV